MAWFEKDVSFNAMVTLMEIPRFVYQFHKVNMMVASF
jgi:hypothetical protein